jgi:hypothetical protein
MLEGGWAALAMDFSSVSVVSDRPRLYIAKIR